MSEKEEYKFVKSRRGPKTLSKCLKEIYGEKLIDCEMMCNTDNCTRLDLRDEKK